MPKREKISGSGRIIELETENMVPRVDAIQKSILDFGQKSILARNRFWPEIDFGQKSILSDGARRTRKFHRGGPLV
jgi:hypothetical protein